ncbi:MAG: hypothetical protein R3C40_00865 [Parvularculaceae bacterium]
MEKRRVLFVAAIVLAGYVVALGVAPYWLPPDAGAPNVAAKLGYNISFAYIMMLAWTVFAVVVISLWGGVNAGSGAASSDGAKSPAYSQLSARIEVAIIFIGIFAAYFPFFLARRGDFIEDKYFLNALWRMQCGDVPYKDFEFLYGPLMIYPAHVWTSIFGFSLKSYYALYALLQAGLFAVLALVLQRYLPQRRIRYVAFLVLLPLLFDTLLGINYLGWRRMLPVFALLLVAANPLNIRAVAAAATILGIEIAYSLEFGLAGLAACGAIYAVMLLRPNRAPVFACGAALAAASLAIAFVLIAVSTGAALPDYFVATRHVLAEASAKGLGAFSFYWTAHSLAAFAVVSLGVVAVAGGARNLTRVDLAEGDRLMLAALAYAIISMKIAFQRVDIWHMASPFIALTLAFMFARPQSVFTFSPMVRQWGIGLSAAASLAAAIGFAPLGLWMASGVVGGGLDIITGKPALGAIASRHQGVETELTHPDRRMVVLAEYLNEPVRRARPVMFYKDRWWAGHHLGVCPVGYTFYDLMYSDELAPLQETLAQTPETLVVMDLSAYEFLFEGDSEELKVKPRKLRLLERLASVLATVHYHQSPIENVIETRMWEENLGDYLGSHYELDARFGKMVVLKRRGEEQGGLK